MYVLLNDKKAYVPLIKRLHNMLVRNIFTLITQGMQLYYLMINPDNEMSMVAGTLNIIFRMLVDDEAIKLDFELQREIEHLTNNYLLAPKLDIVGSGKIQKMVIKSNKKTLQLNNRQGLLEMNKNMTDLKDSKPASGLTEKVQYVTKYNKWGPPAVYVEDKNPTWKPIEEKIWSHGVYVDVKNVIYKERKKGDNLPVALKIYEDLIFKCCRYNSYLYHSDLLKVSTKNRILACMIYLLEIGATPTMDVILNIITGKKTCMKIGALLNCEGDKANNIIFNCARYLNIPAEKYKGWQNENFKSHFDTSNKILDYVCSTCYKEDFEVETFYETDFPMDALEYCFKAMKRVETLFEEEEEERNIKEIFENVQPRSSVSNTPIKLSGQKEKLEEPLDPIILKRIQHRKKKLSDESAVEIKKVSNKSICIFELSQIFKKEKVDKYFKKFMENDTTYVDADLIAPVSEGAIERLHKFIRVRGLENKRLEKRVKNRAEERVKELESLSQQHLLFEQKTNEINHYNSIKKMKNRQIDELYNEVKKSRDEELSKQKKKQMETFDVLNSNELISRLESIKIARERNEKIKAKNLKIREDFEREKMVYDITLKKYKESLKKRVRLTYDPTLPPSLKYIKNKKSMKKSYIRCICVSSAKVNNKIPQSTYHRYNEMIMKTCKLDALLNVKKELSIHNKMSKTNMLKVVNRVLCHTSLSYYSRFY
jgi:hypothetical protein